MGTLWHPRCTRWLCIHDAGVRVFINYGDGNETWMSEAIAAIAACKTPVAEFASSHGTYPADELTAGCSTTATPYVASLAVATGIITAATQHIGATT